jgi:peptide/nickel transport system substrate-binding protein
VTIHPGTTSAGRPRLRGVVRATGLVMVVAIGLAACSSPAKPSAAAGRRAGGTAYWAEAAGSPPDFIFPLLPITHFNLANLGQFQYLMYRPLYWFTGNAVSEIDPSLSLAQTPQFSKSDTTVTVTLRPYTWSDGETVDATDVVFWMNLLRAAKSNWAGYVAGGFPADVTKVVVDSPTTVTFTFDKPYSTRWVTDNALSQITPLPLAWDITAAGGVPGSGKCSAAAYGSGDAPCTTVYQFLSRQAGYDPTNPSAPNTQLTSYTTNPLWQIVDGPWRLKSFDPSGPVVMVPNPTYSGPVKPTLAEFVEVPFATDAAELRALSAGRIDVGYLPSATEARATSNPLVAGGNDPRLKDLSLVPAYLPSINYFLYNFASTGAGGVAGPIVSQLYVRQAMQLLVNQPGEIRKVYRGYAIPTYAPVPPGAGAASTHQGTSSNPYPYDPASAVRLLTRHGWRVVRGGGSVCIRAGASAGECGKGIPAGTKLDLTLTFADDAYGVGALMRDESASWARAGIHVTLTGATSEKVVDGLPPCGGTPGCTWEMANLGVGWPFIVDYYPTGEQIFATGALSNLGAYSNTTADSYIAKTITTNAGLGQYQAYVAKQLPVAFQPNPVASLVEVRHNLGGTTPESLLMAINPENWYFRR